MYFNVTVLLTCSVLLNVLSFSTLVHLEQCCTVLVFTGLMRVKTRRHLEEDCEHYKMWSPDFTEERNMFEV